jgi:hypothetical protein
MAALLMVAGCTGKTNGDPAPVTTTSTTVSSEGGAPPITRPELSLDKFKSDICTILSPEQVAQLGDMDPAKRKDRPGEPVCGWHPKSTSRAVSYTFAISSKTLDDYYRNKDQFPAFEAIDIAGYPAVNFAKLDLKAGDCDTIIGLGKSTALLVQTSSETGAPNYGTPCKNTEKAALLALETIKGSQ